MPMFDFGPMDDCRPSCQQSVAVPSAWRRSYQHDTHSIWFHSSKVAIRRLGHSYPLRHLLSSSTTTSASQRRKKSLQERTPQETLSLIQDVLTALVEAGPRAGPARTLQAYRALTTTIQDFVPIFQSTDAVEPFSAPVASRKLFERLGATYVKLGQFVASSPTLFPKEYVTEFQKCLDQTEPLEWSVIQRIMERELGPISRTFAYVDPKPLASGQHCASSSCHTP
jgi:aarF domain-containing kinase